MLLSSTTIYYQTINRSVISRFLHQRKWKAIKSNQIFSLIVFSLFNLILILSKKSWRELTDLDELRITERRRLWQCECECERDEMRWGGSKRERFDHKEKLFNCTLTEPAGWQQANPERRLWTTSRHVSPMHTISTFCDT